MLVKFTTPVVADLKGNGRCEAYAAGHVIELPKAEGEALIAAGHAFEVEEREFEQATHPVVRKRK